MKARLPVVPTGGGQPSTPTGVPTRGEASAEAVQPSAQNMVPTSGEASGGSIEPSGRAAQPLAFERQARESEKAFAAFALYLSLGLERSTQIVGKRLGKSAGLIERWCAKFDWPARVAAHGAYLAAVEREATGALVQAKAAEWLRRDEALRDQEWETRAEALALAREAIARWQQQKGRCGSLEGIARLLELSSVLGHRATGTPLERVEVTGEDGGPIRVEFEQALAKVYGPVVEVEAEPVAVPAVKEGE